MIANMRLASPSDIAARLDGTAGVVRVPDKRLELFFVREFLDADHCARICALIDAKRRPSTIADDIGVANFRTSETCDLDSRDADVAAVDAKLSALLSMAAAQGEAIQGQRYAPGQEFKPHTDTFNPGGPDYYFNCAEQGQRTWTAMLFLSEPEAGGATRFKTIGKTIQPETGKLLIWNNLLPDGQPNDATLHQGMKVRAGTKYVITKWYRQFPKAG